MSNYSKEAPQKPTQTHGCVLQKASAIKPQSIKWLWLNRLPLGMLSLLAGRGGVGKSTVALSIAATVTRGGNWPQSEDKATPAEVLIMTAEDRLSHVMTPRLIAAEADLDKVRFLTGVKRTVGDEGGTGHFSISRDAKRLSSMLANNPAIRLVIIDPLAAFLDVKDAHRDADVRQALGPLNEIADCHNVAILLIAHLNKGQGRDVRERVSGSGGIVNAVRMAYLAHEYNEQDRVFVSFKENVGPLTRGLVYRIEGRPWNNDGDEIGCAIWVGETTKNAKSILAADDQTQASAPARAEAERFLTQLLSDGPVPSNEIFMQAKDVGVSKATLYRTKLEMGVRAQKVGFKEGWYWKLPEPVE